MASTAAVGTRLPALAEDRDRSTLVHSQASYSGAFLLLFHLVPDECAQELCAGTVMGAFAVIENSACSA
ncbi:hypothetical protein LPH50_02945 [Xylella taiwanensis]|uniref:Uncharacterized protein n=1 Tax=Xylella taiwanensis TaxID=1444770 RepID=A0ABS8TUR7_9GAMM|nr:hypothetical protein [Xylella taiwanensis]MCD8457199.1 hypothetical protein [Xylella taiwanensis]MCD8459608.1 hypothetical protein [Xylella taiwanensis]MCD8461525.1 hypothetical protein [Xylella taiwanensis]MCD8462449.1 hypothetical protein [Xylella taiwanensis]MCD8466232.1 hypothetical protein [Xylella taiwanensis]